MADPGNKGMEQMIPLINKLQDAFQQTGQGKGLKIYDVSVFSTISQFLERILMEHI